MISLMEAARLAGVSKSTMFRAVRNGKVSATRTEHGNFEIDPAEVARVFPDTRRPIHAERDGTGETRMAHLQELLAAAERRTAELIEDRDQWRAQAQRLAGMLAAPAPVHRSGGLFARLFGGMA